MGPRLQTDSLIYPVLHASQEGTAVLTGSYDRTLRIWDLRANNRDPVQARIPFLPALPALSAAMITAPHAQTRVPTYTTLNCVCSACSVGCCCDHSPPRSNVHTHTHSLRTKRPSRTSATRSPESWPRRTPSWPPAWTAACAPMTCAREKSTSTTATSRCRRSASPTTVRVLPYIPSRSLPLPSSSRIIVSKSPQTHTGNCALVNGVDGVIRLLDRSTGDMLNSYKGCAPVLCNHKPPTPTNPIN